MTTPIVDYVRNLRMRRPTMWSACSSPSTWSGTGGSTCCTTRSALRLKTRLLFLPGVMVTSVPWQLAFLPAAGGLGGRWAPGPTFRSKAKVRRSTPTMPPVRRPRRLDPLNRTSLAFHLGRNDIVMAGPELAVGEQLELSIGAVAHGGHCVARVGDDPDSQVVFVRHALPGDGWKP